MSAVLRIKLDSTLAKAALDRYEPLLVRNVEVTLDRGSQDAAATMRGIASKSDVHGARRESIRPVKLGRMHWFVGPGVGYARAAEEGTGPAAGRAAYMPDPRKLEDYVKRRAGITLKGRARSATRRSQEREIRDRAWALALHIRQHGTKASPVVEPTRVVMEPRLRIMVAAAQSKTAREVFGGQGK